MREFYLRLKDGKVYWLVVGIIFLLLLECVLPPLTFPSRSVIGIPDGTGLFQLSEQLREQRVVRSPFWFRMMAIMLGGERRMQAGHYYFAQPENVFTVAWRIFHGDHNIETVKITIPEGFNVAKISALFDERFPYFSHADFEAYAREGYLFPDTYFVPITATASTTIKMLEDNFERKIEKNVEVSELAHHTLEEVIIMASLLEAEAKTQKDREMASDILWKRLKLNMPLQVDSEMGTYEFAGLPEKPINNPGILSIEAALHPTTTPYLYFLTGTDGKMYYAKDFEEHKNNKIKYLSKNP